MKRSRWEAPRGEYDPNEEMILLEETLYESDGSLPAFTTSTLSPYIRQRTPPSSFPPAQEIPYEWKLDYSVVLDDFPAIHMGVDSLQWSQVNDAKAVAIAQANNRWTTFPRGMETSPKVHKKLIIAVKQRKRIVVQYDGILFPVCPVLFTTTHLCVIQFKNDFDSFSMRWMVFLAHKVKKVKILWDDVYMDKPELDLTTRNPVPEEKIQWFKKNEPYVSVYLPEVKTMESPPASFNEREEEEEQEDYDEMMIRTQ